MSLTLCRAMPRNALSLTVSWADSYRPNGRTMNIYSSSIFLSLEIFDFFLSFEKCEMSKINIRMQSENKWSCLWINIYVVGVLHRCAYLYAYQFGVYWNEITLTEENKFNNLNVCSTMKMEKRNKKAESTHSATMWNTACMRVLTFICCDGCKRLLWAVINISLFSLILFSSIVLFSSLRARMITLTTFTFYIHNCLWIWLAHFFLVLVGISYKSILLLATLSSDRCICDDGEKPTA